MAKRNKNHQLYFPEEDKKRKVTGESLKQILEIVTFIKPYRGLFFLGLFFLLLSTVATFAFITFLKDLVDPAVYQTDGWEQEIQSVAKMLVIVLIIQAFFSFMRIYLFARVSERTMADIRNAIYQHLLVLPLSFFEKRRVGELTSRITGDVTQLQNALSVSLAEFIRQIATFLIGVVLLFGISVKLSLIMLSTFPVAIICAIFIGKYIRKVAKKSQDALAEGNVIVEETLQSIQVVKAFVNERFEALRYQKHMSEVVNFALKAANARGIFVVFLITAVFGGITLVVWFGVNMIGQGVLTTGSFIYFIMVTMFIGGSIAGLGDLYGQLQRTIGASERIRGILRENTEYTFSTQPPNLASSISGHIIFENVHFRYPTRPDVNVLKGVNLDIETGEKVALVGYSGAGKSTIANLVLHFYPLEQGQIYIDQKPIHSFTYPELRSQIGIVPQEVLLFGGTIRENIAYGRPGASLSDIQHAAKQAYAWEFIQQFPEGIETIVGERGVKLSGGQRQRIAIARAVLKDPSILILDEATSSLDAESEHLVQAALDHLMEGRTTIIIAHRLSTIRKVDRIYVLNEGKIAESGSHNELSIRDNGIYQNLLKLQLETNETG